MSKFNPTKTTQNLVIFGDRLAHQLAFGIYRGSISSSNKDKQSEIREFLRKHADELPRAVNVNVKVSNILKTPKQLDLVISLIECKYDIMTAQQKY